MIVLFNKPCGVLCQFTDAQGRATLADYIPLPGVYAAGRLDRDSEGLLVLTDEPGLQHRLAHPRNKTHKVYWAQVEGSPAAAALRDLARGVSLKDGPARALSAALMPEPDGLWPRQPPVRKRQSVPTAWLSLTLDEGRNRQVRRMTAAVGHPTLRLIRARIGSCTLAGLRPGEWCRVLPGEGG